MLRCATGHSPRTWSCRSQVRRPATGSPECSPRHHLGTERALSPGNSRCNSDAARARPPGERAARRDGRTEDRRSPRQLPRPVRRGESQTAHRSLAGSSTSRAWSNSRSKCPVRRSSGLSDLFIQLTNLALNISHRVVSRHLGLAQVSHLLRVLVRHAGSRERECVAVQPIRGGSVLAQCRKRRPQPLPPSLETGCVLSQVAGSHDVRQARLPRRVDAELPLPANWSRSVQALTHSACESRPDAFYGRANDHVFSTLRPLLPTSRTKAGGRRSATGFA
jgi:hypothetical protein